MNAVLHAMKNSRFDFVLLVTLVLAFASFNALWLWHFQRGQLLDIDEAGYIGFAVADYQSLAHGGILAFIRTVEAPSIQAPLTTLLAGLAFAFTGVHILSAFGVVVLAGAGCVAAAFFLARAFGMGRLSLAPALLVASCPLILNFSRDFQFSIPTTFVVTASLACLANSQRMTRPGWSVLYGVFLGLMPLSRTMTLAFIPALLAGTLVYVYAEGLTRWRWKTLWLTVSSLTALLVALSWLGPNGKYVFHYLTSYGYGSHAAEYDHGELGIGLLSLIFTFKMLGEYVCLPQFLFIVVAFVMGVFLLIRVSAKNGLIYAGAALLRTPAIPAVAFISGVVLALSSTANKGNGFIAPAVPAMLVLACMLLQRACLTSFSRALYITAVALVAAFGVVPASGLSELTQPIRVTLPVFGNFKLTSPAAHVRNYVMNDQSPKANEIWPMPTAKSQQYVNSFKAAAEYLHGNSAAIGFRGLLFNVNEIILYQEMQDIPRSPALFQIDPVAVAATRAGVSSWLTKGPLASVCYLVLSNDVAHQFPPAIPSSVVEEGAQDAKFNSSDTTWTLPDGEIFTVWQRADCK
ncbi:MAG: glycosyltransferase family 39 protein [Rhodospirillales bacterium]|nr:glycosyltransferase family 39 protein [Rhodospirillales bacterium]